MNPSTRSFATLAFATASLVLVSCTSPEPGSGGDSSTPLPVSGAETDRGQKLEPETYRNLVEETRSLARAAMADYGTEDWASFCRKMETALALRPDQPELLYNSAAGQARAGNADSAFVHLERFLEMGMTAPFGRDEDFATLHPDPRWQPLLDHAEANAQPFGAAERAFSFDAPELLPEGVAFDPVSGDFFIGGVRGRSVWRIHPADGDRKGGDVHGSSAGAASGGSGSAAEATSSVAPSRSSAGTVPGASSVSDASARLYLTASSQPFGSVFGLAVDSERRRLFICTAWMAETPGATEDRIGSSALHVLDLDQERWIGMHELAANGARRILNDLALDSRGNVYLTDNQTGDVWWLAESEVSNLATALPIEESPKARASASPSDAPASQPDAQVTPMAGGDGHGRVESLAPSALRQLPLLPKLLSPQGIVVTPDDRTLYIADYSLGIVAVELPGGAHGGESDGIGELLRNSSEKGARGKTERLPLHAVRLSPIATTSLIGIDGLARYGNDLLVVQNGVRPHRVLRLRMEPDGKTIRSAETLLAAHPDFDEPTLGVVVGDRFDIVANSQWPSLAPDGGVKEGYEVHGPIVLSVPLGQ